MQRQVSSPAGPCEARQSLVPMSGCRADARLRGRGVRTYAGCDATLTILSFRIRFSGEESAFVVVTGLSTSPLHTSGEKHARPFPASRYIYPAHNFVNPDSFARLRKWRRLLSVFDR